MHLDIGNRNLEHKNMRLEYFFLASFRNIIIIFDMFRYPQNEVLFKDRLTL